PTRASSKSSTRAGSSTACINSPKILSLADFLGEPFPVLAVTLELLDGTAKSRMPALERHFVGRMAVLEFFQYLARAGAQKQIDEKSGGVRVRRLRRQRDAAGVGRHQFERRPRNR